MIPPDWETLKKQNGKQLPHWDCKKAIYHVCFRLADSIPKGKLQQWFLERELIIRSAAFKNGKLTKEEQKRLQYLFSDKIEKFLDVSHGECHLRRVKAAEIVKEALQHFDGQRYYLHAWSIMPNHVHTIMEPAAGYRLSKIVHTWKSFTANRINRQLDRTGPFWQHETYDHIIRSENEYWDQVEYVWRNPEKAGLIKCLRWRLDKPESLV